MRSYLQTQIAYITVVLIVLSMSADVGAYFSGGASSQAIGRWTLLGAVLSSVLAVATGLRGGSRGYGSKRRRWVRRLLVGFVLLGTVIALNIWRWSSGVAVVSSFDGGYPILAAFALLLAAYQGWLSEKH